MISLKKNLINNMYNSFWSIVGKIIGIILLIAAIVGVFGYCIMLLWNWLMPVIFGLPIITFWQAVGIDVLMTILFIPVHFNITYKKEF